MFYDPLSVSNEEENAQNILCINDHRQWASPMFTINVNQALVYLTVFCDLRYQSDGGHSAPRYRVMPWHDGLPKMICYTYVFWLSVR
jgi:hypothetical protein